MQVHEYPKTRGVQLSDVQAAIESLELGSTHPSANLEDTAVAALDEFFNKSAPTAGDEPKENAESDASKKKGGQKAAKQEQPCYGDSSGGRKKWLVKFTGVDGVAVHAYGYDEPEAVAAALVGTQRKADRSRYTVEPVK